jgi:hypothetical protein
MEFTVIQIFPIGKNSQPLSCREFEKLIGHRIPHSQYDKKKNAIKIPLESFGVVFQKIPFGYKIISNAVQKK